MVRKGLFFVLIFCLSILAACGNGTKNSESSDKATIGVEEDSPNVVNFGTEMYSSESEQDSISQAEDDAGSDKTSGNALDRKVIYTADLQVEVKNYEKSLQNIQSEVTRFDGYIVESSMYEDPEISAKNGQITARIPQEGFQEFIKIVEEGSSKVLESSTSGQDVTEEYVDLESRLKSKRVVEDRLLSFMEQAKKTEDLLKISSDLADVQGEIEEITGRMKYLENKSDLATVTIFMQENNVSIKGTGKDKLNTWEQTKQQFMKSINFLITACSSVFVFLIGNLPIIILIGIISLAIVVFIKKRSKVKKAE